MYWPVAQIRNTPALAIVVRTAATRRPCCGPARAAMAEVDPAQPIFGLQTVEQLVAASLGSAASP